MDSFRKWFYRPRRDDPSLLAQFYYADEELNLVAGELDTFDGRKDPERCTSLVNQLRHCQDKVVSLCMTMMEAVIPGERANRDFRAKFPDDVMQENLAGQLWFGAECLAAGSSILNRESESSRMRPLAKAVTKTIETVRNLLREQCLKPVPEYTEKIRESLKIFDRLFSEFELNYVSAMVPVKSPEEHEVLQCVVVLFSETVQRALRVELITQDQVDDCDPALMFTIPRLAIVAGLLLFPDGPLNLDGVRPRNLSHLFRPFRTLLSKIRELLWTMSSEELAALEKSLCSLEEPQHSCLTLPANSTYCVPGPAAAAAGAAAVNQHDHAGVVGNDNGSVDQGEEEAVEVVVVDGGEERSNGGGGGAVPLAYVHTAYTSNFIQSFLSQHPDMRTLTTDISLLPQSEKRTSGSSSSGRSSSERKRDRDSHHHGGGGSGSHRSSSGGAGGGSSSGGHRSSSSRTRLRQERLSDRFLAKLTGVEERPKVRRRSKRSSATAVSSGASSSSVPPPHGPPSHAMHQDSLPQQEGGPGLPPRGSSSRGGGGGGHAEDGGRGRRPLPPDPLTARRLEYLAQHDLYRTRPPLQQQYERVQRQQGDTDALPYTNYTFRDTIDYSAGGGGFAGAPPPPPPPQAAAPRHPPPPVPPPPSHHHSHGLLPPPPLPASAYPPNNNDSDSEQDRAQSQQRPRPRRLRSSHSSSHAQAQFSAEYGRPNHNSSSSDRPSPRVPPHLPSTQQHDASDFSSSSQYYSHLPEPLPPRHSTRQHRPRQHHTAAAAGGSKHVDCCEDCQMPDTLRRNSRISSNLQDANAHRAPIHIQSIECSCGSSLQTAAYDQTEGLDASETRTCHGLCLTQSSGLMANSSVSQTHLLNNSNLSNNVDLLNRPTSIYIPSANDEMDGGDELNYSGALVRSISECVSSAVAADPTILGPHNLYLHQDMPVPDYHHLPLPDYHLDDISPSNTESFLDDQVPAIPEECEEASAAGSCNVSVRDTPSRGSVLGPLNCSNSLSSDRAIVNSVDRSLSESNTLTEENQGTSVLSRRTMQGASPALSSEANKGADVRLLEQCDNASGDDPDLCSPIASIGGAEVASDNKGIPAIPAGEVRRDATYAADETTVRSTVSTAADDIASVAVAVAGSTLATEIVSNCAADNPVVATNGNENDSVDTTAAGVTSEHVHLHSEDATNSCPTSEVHQSTGPVTAGGAAPTSPLSVHVPEHAASVDDAGGVHGDVDRVDLRGDSATAGCVGSSVDVDRVREDVGESSTSSGESGSEGAVLSDDELNDEEVALALQAVEVAAAWRSRARFSDPRDLIQRLFVCISGVADQLQTNYASDLRRILKTVFLLNQTSSEEEDDLLLAAAAKEGSKGDIAATATDQDGHSTSNDSESLSVESAEDALAGLGSSSQPSSPSHSCHREAAGDRTPLLPQPAHHLPPTVCVPPSVFHDHSLLQFSEVTQASNNSPSDSSPTSSNHSPHSTPQAPPSGATIPSTGPETPRTGGAETPLAVSEDPPLLPATSPGTPPPVAAGTARGADVSRRSVEEPPCWVPDTEAPRCMACGASFTVLRRRHHCRNCGKVFCGGCSQHSVPLTHYGIWKPVRVCNMCFLQYVTAAATASS